MFLNKVFYSFFISLFILNLPSSKGQSIYKKKGQSIYKKYDIYRNPLLVIANKISWTLSTGTGRTQFNHSLKNFYLYQSADIQLIRSKNAERLSGDLINGQTNWLNSPEDSKDVNIGNLLGVVNDPLDSLDYNAHTIFLDVDTTDFQFQGLWSSRPLDFSAHYDFFKFRIGVGINYEKLRTNSLRPTTNDFGILDYDPGFKTTKLYKYYGLIGYKFYEAWNSAMVGVMQIGNVRSSGEFNNKIINRSLMMNIGLDYEYHFSEYLRLILKPSFEIKSYEMIILDASEVFLDQVSHSYNAFYLQIGISMNVPELRRSPIKADHVQLKHVITHPRNGRLEEVRGQPFWKKQNPKIGQNHRRFIKDKVINKKNRRLINFNFELKND